MADTKLTGLTENSTPAATDIMYIVDDPGGSPLSQKITLANLKTLFNDLATAAIFDALGDLVVGTGANTAAKLSVGANGTVLTADDGEATGLKWSAAASGSVATDAIWDAAGDLVQGTGANTAARLGIGTANQLLRVNSGATAVEWASVGRVLITESTPTGTTVTWDSIPGTYKTLEIEYTARTDKASVATEEVNIYFNNDTTDANYSYQRLSVTDTGTTAARQDLPNAVVVPAATATANYFGHGWLKIISYASAAITKDMFGMTWRRQAAADQYWANFTQNWESTSAITRIDIVTEDSGNFIAGTTWRLYGVY